MDEVEKRVIADQSKDARCILRCSFTQWVEGKGLLGCQDETTAEYLSRLISQIRVGGKSFKAWLGGGGGRGE